MIRLTHHLEEIAVFERTAEQFKLQNEGIDLVQGEVNTIDKQNKVVELKGK